MRDWCNSCVGRLCLAALPFLSLGWDGELKGNEPLVPQTTEELEHAILAILQETHVPGAGVVLVSKDEVLWQAEIGLADRDARREVTRQTMFPAGGISNTFVALALLKLQEEGGLQIDDRLRDLVGSEEFSNPWEESEPLRLVHLLEQTSGFAEISLHALAANEPNISVSDSLTFNPQSRSSCWRPGRFFSYSMAGYNLAGYVVERVSKKTFDRYMDEEIFGPLDMENASFLHTDTVHRNLTACYRLDGMTEVPYDHVVTRPAGALNTTPEELAHLVQMLLNRGTYQGVRLLNRESVERMETPTTSAAARRGMRDGYGLGIYTISYKGFRFYRHGGAFQGFVSFYGYVPDHGVGYVIMINARNGEAMIQIERLIHAYLTRGWAMPTPSSAALSHEQLQTFAGYYEPLVQRFVLAHFVDRLLGIKRVVSDNGLLRVRGLLGEPEALLPVDAKGFFRGEEDPAATAAFVEEDGELYFVRADIFKGTSRRIPAWWVWWQFAVAGLCLMLMSSSVLFALVWVPRWVLGRMRGAHHLSMRLLPLLAVICLVATFIVLAKAAASNPLANLGNLTPWSLNICVLTWLFAAATVASVAQVIRARRWDVNRWVLCHALLVSVANAVVLGYLTYWGIIGVRTWA